MCAQIQWTVRERFKIIFPRTLIANRCAVFMLSYTRQHLIYALLMRMLEMFFRMCTQLKMGCACMHLYLILEYLCHVSFEHNWYSRCSFTFNKGRQCLKSILCWAFFAHRTHESSTCRNVHQFLLCPIQLRFLPCSWSKIRFAWLPLSLPYISNMISAQS